MAHACPFLGIIAEIYEARASLTRPCIRREELLPVFEKLETSASCQNLQRKTADVYQARGQLGGSTGSPGENKRFRLSQRMGAVVTLLPSNGRDRRV